MQGGVKNTSLGDPNAFYFEPGTITIWLSKLKFEFEKEGEN